MSACVRFKDGVTLGDPPTPAQIRILSALDQTALAIKHDLTVSCGREAHPAADPHSKGQALDIRTRDLTPHLLVLTYNALCNVLGPDWTVLYESPTQPDGALADIARVNPSALGTHLHIQPVKGTSFPKETP